MVEFEGDNEDHRLERYLIDSDSNLSLRGKRAVRYCYYFSGLFLQ